MPYPYILATDGQEIARINVDTRWSVRWDAVFDMAYAKPHPRRMAVQAYARLLVAAKDNFVLMPWDESDRKTGAWDHYENIIDFIDTDARPGALNSTITMNGLMIAQVNADGSWSVSWEDILELAEMKNCTYPAIALVGICKLFKAAKDRFLVTPWPVEEEDD